MTEALEPEPAEAVPLPEAAPLPADAVELFDPVPLPAAAVGLDEVVVATEEAGGVIGVSVPAIGITFGEGNGFAGVDISYSPILFRSALRIP